MLLEVPKDVLEHRLAERKNHYMSPALLDSQIATLEMPRDAIRVAGDLPPDQVVRRDRELRSAGTHCGEVLRIHSSFRFIYPEDLYG